MTARALQISFLLVLFVIFLNSCFKEDSPIAPVNQTGIQIKTSIYDHQTFFDLSDDSYLTNANDIWDLAFESGKSAWRIRINFSNFKGVFRLGAVDFNSTTFTTNDAGWIYDASSGNTDSLAIGNWTEAGSEGQQVFLLGTYDGIRYKAFKKLKFNAVTDTSYSFTFANLDNTDKADVIVKKDTSCNYTYFSLSKKSTVAVEPAKNDWDILFTQYTTTLFTDNGIRTPNYPVRGVYLNPNNVASMLDTVDKYQDITAQNIIPSQMSSIQDVIGYNWKSVKINQSANTGEYAIRKNYTYIIRDTEGAYYKLHFLSFVNDSLLVGYPSFEKAKL